MPLKVLRKTDEETDDEDVGPGCIIPPIISFFRGKRLPLKESFTAAEADSVTAVGAADAAAPNLEA